MLFGFSMVTSIIYGMLNTEYTSADRHSTSMNGESCLNTSETDRCSWLSDLDSESHPRIVIGGKNLGVYLHRDLVSDV